VRPRQALDYEILLCRISGLGIAELGLGGGLQTVFGADAVPRPEFSNATFLELLSATDKWKHHSYNCLWKSLITLGQLQISLESQILLQMAFKLELISERVSSALKFWILVSELLKLGSI